MKYTDVKTMAECWGFEEKKVTRLCREGRIVGAIKEDGVWRIPERTSKPVDGRSNKGKNQKVSITKLPLPIGVSDFKELVSGYYYVDKTMLIKEFLDRRPKVSLFTRPRRFGKTLAMDMMKTFFELTDEDTSKYFKGKQIWQCGEQYRREQGQYPVISVSFKDIKYASWQLTYEGISKVIAEEYQRHIYLLESPSCNEYDRKYFMSILDGTVTEVGLAGALSDLSRMLYAHHERRVMIMVDEYDTPIQQGYVSGYYQETVGFMRNLFSAAFKDNRFLAYGFLTGILRVAKGSIFSGMNNLIIHSVLDEQYSDLFGFTSDEVQDMAEYYGVPDRYDDICEWYDGYLFGNREIFNPWSALNYFYYNCVTQPYWQYTGDNSIIKQIVSEADDETAENLRRLMQGDAISTYIDTSVIYPEIKSNPTTIYSFLLAAGYLKTVKKNELYDGNAICGVAIPNKEIFYVYEREILSALSKILPQSTAIAVQHAILTQDIPKLQEHMQKLLIYTISSFDYAQETFYHGLMLGICAVMNNLYLVDSNRESGHGRYDIGLRPIHNKRLPGIIIEIKVLRENMAEDQIETELEKSADEALKQIERKQYIADMQKEGITEFLKIGVSFYKKHVKIKSEM